jgi:hypothetical protein
VPQARRNDGGSVQDRATVHERGGRGAVWASSGTGGPTTCTGDLEGERHWQPGGDANRFSQARPQKNRSLIRSFRSHANMHTEAR